MVEQERREEQPDWRMDVEDVAEAGCLINAN